MSVILITSQLLTREIWGPQTEALSGLDPVYADNGSDDSIGGMAERLLAAAPERFDLVAQGMGGFVAFEVMRRAPQRVSSLALIATLAPNDGPAQTERRLGYLHLVEQGRFEQVVEERIPILVHPARREDAPLLSVVRRMAADTGAQTFMRQQRAIMARADSRPTLATITCPTLAIWGRQDGITTLAYQEEIVGGVAGARLEVIEDCGHLVTLEKPITATRVLKQWLESQTGAAKP